MPIAEPTIEYLAKADDWATKAADLAIKDMVDAEMLKDTAKDVLAKIMSDLELERGETSEVKLERLARSTKNWRDYQYGKHEAIQKALRAKVRANNAERHFRTVQSMVSYRKEELSRVQGV